MPKGIQDCNGRSGAMQLHKPGVLCSTVLIQVQEGKKTICLRNVLCSTVLIQSQEGKHNVFTQRALQQQRALQTDVSSWGAQEPGLSTRERSTARIGAFNRSGTKRSARKPLTKIIENYLHTQLGAHYINLNCASRELDLDL